jgi:predicted nuclease of predicted toxin-antitoxin system
MKILIDMNLSPQWVPFLAAARIDSIHWSQVEPGMTILTQDLDFGALLSDRQSLRP